MSQLLRFPGGVERDPAVEAWMDEHPGELGAIARRWFEVIRGCGGDVRELLHDGHPTACIDDAAFAYVNVFTAHVNVGFFRGAELPDPDRLLEGTGRFMRHVKLRPDGHVDATALAELIHRAYADMTKRLEEPSGPAIRPTAPQDRSAQVSPSGSEETPMDTAKLQEFGARYTAAWCSQHAASVATFFAEGGSLKINDGAPSVGRTAITAAAQGFMTAFPDMVVTMAGVSVEGDQAIYRWTLTGTNTGPGGTGKQVRIEGYEEWTLGADGLIAESKGHYDEAEYARQLQVGAPPAQ
jgi:hypothetical protein